MTHPESKQLRCNFLINEALTASVTAAFNRAGIYVDGVDDRDKQSFRTDLKHELEGLSKLYRGRTPSQKEHLETIIGLADRFSAGPHSPILRKGRFRIGIAQKALNLFLKYLWCMGKIKRPPHCPFDSIVLEAVATHVSGTKLTPWTRMDSPSEYDRYVAAAQAAAKGQPLSDWELEVWENR